eukprot:2996077-Pyramimonas_sp.AAC.1
MTAQEAPRTAEKGPNTVNEAPQTTEKEPKVVPREVLQVSPRTDNSTFPRREGPRRLQEGPLMPQ